MDDGGEIRNGSRQSDLLVEAAHDKAAAWTTVVRFEMAAGSRIYWSKLHMTKQPADDLDKFDKWYDRVIGGSANRGVGCRPLSDRPTCCRMRCVAGMNQGRPPTWSVRV
jgi:hypothetical protein